MVLAAATSPKQLGDLKRQTAEVRIRTLSKTGVGGRPIGRRLGVYASFQALEETAEKIALDRGFGFGCGSRKAGFRNHPHRRCDERCGCERAPARCERPELGHGPDPRRSCLPGRTRSSWECCGRRCPRRVGPILRQFANEPPQVLAAGRRLSRDERRGKDRNSPKKIILAMACDEASKSSHRS